MRPLVPAGGHPHDPEERPQREPDAALARRVPGEGAPPVPVRDHPYGTRGAVSITVIESRSPGLAPGTSIGP